MKPSSRDMRSPFFLHAPSLSPLCCFDVHLCPSHLVFGKMFAYFSLFFVTSWLWRTNHRHHTRIRDTWIIKMKIVCAHGALLAASSTHDLLVPLISCALDTLPLERVSLCKAVCLRSESRRPIRVPCAAMPLHCHLCIHTSHATGEVGGIGVSPSIIHNLGPLRLNKRGIHILIETVAYMSSRIMSMEICRTAAAIMCSQLESK